MNIKSPLRYPGGKSRAVKLIKNLVPSFKEFREPFVGGGSIYIYFKQSCPEKKYWINDLYYELYVFWAMCQKDLNPVLNQVKKWKEQYNDNGRELHKILIQNIEKFDLVKKASAFFILNRITFSGTTLSGGYSEQTFKWRFTDSSIERLEKLRYLIKNTKITNLDYEDVIREPGKDVFVFLDPPYYTATKSALYGKNGNFHKGFDHERFANVMRKSNHKWLITYDDSEYIRKLFSFANIMSWNLMYGMRNVNKDSDQIGKELFISNYIDSLPEKNQLNLL